MGDFNSYHGDVNLGLGSTPAIPAEALVGLDTINQTGRDLLLLNHENNINIYRQKLADRQQQLKLLDAGQIQTGQILDKDRPIIKDYQTKTDKAFTDMVKAGGVSNPDAVKGYQDTVRELQDAVTNAQHRYLGRQQLVSEKSKQPLETTQKQYDNHLANQDSKGFWDGTYEPYQQSLTLDLDPIKKQAAITPFEYNVNDKGVQDVKGTTKVSGTQFSYPQTLKNLTDKYLQNADDLFHQQKLLSSVEQLQPQQKANAIDAMNARIGKYNTENGLAEGQEGYVAPVQVTPDGKIGERPTDFAAKWVLSEQPAFKITKNTLDDKAANLALKTQSEKTKAAAEQEKVRHDKAMEALDRTKFKEEMNLQWYESKQKLKTNEAKGVWVNDQTVSLITKARRGTAIADGDFKGEYKSNSKSLRDLFKTETTNALGKKITTYPDDVYVTKNNEVRPVFKKNIADGDKTISVVDKDRSVPVSPDELKALITESQFGKGAQTVLDASNEVLRKTVNGASLNDNVRDYYNIRNPNEQSFSVEQLKKNGWTDIQIQKAQAAGKIKID